MVFHLINVIGIRVRNKAKGGDKLNMSTKLDHQYQFCTHNYIHE